MVYDLVIKNGYVIEGTGRDRFKANVYVKDQKIALIDSDGPEFGEKIIDAKGMIVSPGFIDMHSHSDFTIFENRRAESLIHQGATTLYFTPDGWSPAPVIEEHRRELKEYYEPLTFGAKLPFNWTSYDGYFKRLEEGGIGVNVRANVGFGTVRMDVIGLENRDPTSSEMEQMKELVDQSFIEGVGGLSTGLTYHPQCYSKKEEVLELLKVVAEHGGVYHTHTRGGVEGMKEALWLSERSKVPVILTHTTPSDEEYKLIEEADSRGVAVSFDAYPYTAGSSFLSAMLPAWVHEGNVDEMLLRIKRNDTREKIREEWEKIPANKWPKGIQNTPLIGWVQNERSKKYEGKTLNEVAEMMDVDPLDAFCNILIENNNNVMRVGLHNRLYKYVKRAFQHHLMSVGSDAWALAPYGSLHVGCPHPRSYGTFPKILGMYVRLMGLQTLEEAINKMTWASAQRMHVNDRGVLKNGMAADITIFDSETVIDNATYRDPHQYPTGIEYVIVNGEIVIDKGEHTGKLAGKVLRHKSKKE